MLLPKEQKTGDIIYTTTNDFWLKLSLKKNEIKESQSITKSQTSSSSNSISRYQTQRTQIEESIGGILEFPTRAMTAN